MRVIGIDPGITGAIAVLDDGRFSALADIPVLTRKLTTGRTKKEVDAAETLRLLRSFGPLGYEVHVGLERVGPQPGQAVSGVFSLGDTFGALRAVCAISNFDTQLVDPGTWKRKYKLSQNKKLSLAMARALYPEAPLNLEKHIDRAEALLIARFVWEKQFA